MSSPAAQSQTIIEPFLDPKNARARLFPIQYDDLWEFYILHKAAFWTPEEITLTNDLNDWNDKLTDDERYYLKMVLAFFSASDLIVNENCEKDNESEISILEYQFFNRFKMMMEDIHSITYANLIDTYIRKEDEKAFLFNAVQNIPIIKLKADWSRQYIDKGDFATRLIAFAIVEGIFFSGSFCAIFWLRKRQLLAGLCTANDFIARDEGIHRDFAILVYRKYIVHKKDKSEVISIIKDAVKIEQEFCCKALPVSLIGMNSDLMGQYIEYVSDQLCDLLIGQKIYNTKNPFPWMTTMGIGSKEDFFANRPTNYANQNVLHSSKNNENDESDDDF